MRGARSWEPAERGAAGSERLGLRVVFRFGEPFVAVERRVFVRWDFHVGEFVFPAFAPEWVGVVFEVEVTGVFVGAVFGHIDVVIPSGVFGQVGV